MEEGNPIKCALHQGPLKRTPLHSVLAILQVIHAEEGIEVCSTTDNPKQDNPKFISIWLLYAFYKFCSQQGSFLIALLH